MWNFFYMRARMRLRIERVYNMQIRKKFSYIIGVISGIIAAFIIAVALFSGETIDNKNIIVPEGYVLYNPGKKIDFTEKGNSDTFIKESDGWGGQGDTFRCALGSDSVLNLYIHNDKMYDFKLELFGYSVFKPGDNFQVIEVYANETRITDWYMNSQQTYTAVIPKELLQDGKLTIRFHAEKPYAPEENQIKVSMVVSSVRIKAIRGTGKAKMWLKKRFVNLVGEPSPEDLKLYEIWNKP